VRLVSPPGLRRALAAARARPLVAVAVGGLLVAALNIWWVAAHRRLGALTIDEVGYMATGLGYHRALRADGPAELLRQVFLPSPTGPLVPVLSVPALIAGPRSITTLFATQTLIGVLAAVAAAGCSLRIAGRGAAMLTGLVVLSLPGMIGSARSYQYAAAVGACMLLALWALLCSDRGSSRWHMVGFGAAVGAMLLARSMALGFVPGLAIASLIVIRKDRRAWTNLAWSVLAVVAVAGPWWWASRGPLFDYLFRYGYGDQAREYGSGGFLTRAVERWIEVGTDVRLPYVLLGIACVGVSLAVAVAGARGTSPSRWWRSHRELLAVTSVVVVGVVALMSTANVGVWFELPLELVAAVGIVSAGAVAGRRELRLVGRLAAITAVATLVVSATDPGGQDHPGGARGVVQALVYSNVHDFYWDVAAADPQLSSNDPRVRNAAADAWWAAALHTTERLEAMRAEDDSLLVTASGASQLLHGQTLRLVRQLELLPEVDTEEVDSTAPIDDLLPHLDPSPDGRRRVLVLMQPNSKLFPPDREVARLATLARDHGWQVVDRVELPDGGHVEILDTPQERAR